MSAGIVAAVRASHRSGRGAGEVLHGRGEPQELVDGGPHERRVVEQELRAGRDGSVSSSAAPLSRPVVVSLPPVTIVKTKPTIHSGEAISSPDLDEARDEVVAGIGLAALDQLVGVGEELQRRRRGRFEAVPEALAATMALVQRVEALAIARSGTPR